MHCADASMPRTPKCCTGNIEREETIRLEGDWKSTYNEYICLRRESRAETRGSASMRNLIPVGVW